MVSSEAALCELSAPPVVVLVVAVVCCRPYDEPDFFVSVSEAMSVSQLQTSEKHS